MKTGIPNPTGDADELLITPADAIILRLALASTRDGLVEMLAKLDASIAVAAGEPPPEPPPDHIHLLLSDDEAGAVRALLAAQLDRVDALIAQLDAKFPRPTAPELGDDGTPERLDDLAPERFDELRTDALWWAGAPMPCRHCGASVDEECAPDCLRRLPTTPPPGIKPDDDDPPEAA